MSVIRWSVGDKRRLLCLPVVSSLAVVQRPEASGEEQWRRPWQQQVDPEEAVFLWPG